MFCLLNETTTKRGAAAREPFVKANLETLIKIDDCTHRFHAMSVTSEDQLLVEAAPESILSIVLILLFFRMGSGS